MLCVDQHITSSLQEFLNDYGMVWVGSGEERGREEEEEEEEEEEGGAGGGEKLWVPQSSLPSLKVDFDLIIKNVKVSVNVERAMAAHVETVFSAGAECSGGRGEH